MGQRVNEVEWRVSSAARTVRDITGAAVDVARQAVTERLGRRLPADEEPWYWDL